MEGNPNKEYAADYLEELKKLNASIATDQELLAEVKESQALQIVGARLKRSREQRNALYAKHNIVHKPYEDERRAA
ncbi:hypothetical protein A3I46_02055 [Candidatus Kaiserbacteria bacterium RIFCSPLOWO2_02_FULL_54_13]|uniref:Uncharacterized protein n=1 Tax=Candidatus Kaiserbacteria bacterium RIFCSPHIGHO2_02_FULL_54_22 TaxID=1798495 RepID=A0A1F6DLY8_9BACT|nr:MAG: hypothetical protein UY91_C0029G0007 [Parcubacteria group bacterium GW2011_GWB1_55_9]OGG62022.1 MAG: hypothetical protein A3C19_02810 [Candidatus Kaiserbacteria bacterium RIFCSPHIGHO2_02_FULL_54_22]OGG67774.1 MAG: hypothetical protein A3E99_03405 [Candidatus Kaiserbacteria bacterium RIFCSPHIGHO2_12_FULL_54_16]OGG82910.1 MAG: hypothetical protein A3I46_02055 [Candidatus Kaiserbacteria bacterium RIFCSPLOWO2_02_FULL_54_13]OGG90465.1 MAG: hypothetical protein A3G12_02385 [Candidatus Kaiserb